MKQSQKTAVLTLLVREMLGRGSWCGETHIQKATFFLQELVDVQLDFGFILYRHGPFSFELRDELSSMQADDILSLQLRRLGYGASLVPTRFSEVFLDRFPKTVSKYQISVEFVADKFGQMNVSELERIATAFYIVKYGNFDGVDERVEELTDIKPHISESDAHDAFASVDQLMREVHFLGRSGEFATGHTW